MKRWWSDSEVRGLPGIAPRESRGKRQPSKSRPYDRRALRLTGDGAFADDADGPSGDDEVREAEGGGEPGAQDGREVPAPGQPVPPDPAPGKGSSQDPSEAFSPLLGVA